MELKKEIEKAKEFAMKVRILELQYNLHLCADRFVVRIVNNEKKQLWSLDQTVVRYKVE